MRDARTKSSRSSRTNASISSRFIEVGGIRVEVVRKPIRNLHLSVHPRTDASVSRRRRPRGTGAEGVEAAEPRLLVQVRPEVDMDQVRLAPQR
jgi:hypothetical protein